MLPTDEGSRAARVSRVVQTSKQAAWAGGGWPHRLTPSTLGWPLAHVHLLTVSSRLCAAEGGPEENLHSSEGQSHM